ncbi:hypothetical protein [Erwinia sp. ErVv1]|uniref:hypothetical protein n=1 Tax=Erwinia sp. ErVv1 TaxID=1603299 RepID=UPI00082F256F|nr:hypothetical protein [Erwinia sp. ErVv1]
MKLNKWSLFFISNVILLFSAAVQAIEVFPIVKDIRQERPRDNFITVKSAFRSSDTEAQGGDSNSQRYEFVTLELFRVTNPGDTNENRVKELGTADPTLLFSPTKLIVPYGEERKVRILPLKPVGYETVYRLRIRPSYPEQESDKGKVRFAVGYDVLLRYLPPGKHTAGISLSCKDNAWTLRATGNVRSELRNLIIDGRKDRKSFNVYPNHARSLTVSRHLSFEMDGKLQVYDMCEHKE